MRSLESRFIILAAVALVAAPTSVALGQGAPAAPTASPITLDGTIDAAFFHVTEDPFAAPLAGGSTENSDFLGELAACNVYDTGTDPNVPDFNVVSICNEGLTADIQQVYTTWDADYLYFGIVGPTAFHTGFGPPDRGDLFIAIDTQDSAIDLVTPAQPAGGDMFAKLVDFAGWSPDFFVGVEFVANGGGSGYAQLNTAAGVVVAADTVPAVDGGSDFEFNAHKDNTVTEIKIAWTALGLSPDVCLGTPLNFAVYTTADLDGFDTFDTAPGIGQGSSFEQIGDTPFDADHCGGSVDPVSGVGDTSCGFGESDDSLGSGNPVPPKIPSSDNTGSFNNNEVDTIQEYFRVLQAGELGTLSDSDDDGAGDICDACPLLAGEGDVNGDGSVNLVDVQCGIATALWDYAGQEGEAPSCLGGGAARADANCNGDWEIDDIKILVLLALNADLPSAVDANDDLCPDTCELP
jgi:hypothetical protein